MRLLLELSPSDGLAELLEAGTAAYDAGLDGVLLCASAAQPAPLIGAAALAGALPDILVAVEVPLGDRHPLELAEEAVVVDVASGGRLILITRPAAAAEEHYGEALDLLRTAFAAAPFRFEGARWRVPANLAENEHGIERRTRLTPTPARPRLEIWSSGDGFDKGVARALGHLADERSDLRELGRQWSTAQAEWGPALIGVPRGRRVSWTGPAELLASLRDGRDAFAQDWAAVAAPAAQARLIGTHVRPRVQLDRLPSGLEAHWDEAPECPPIS